MTTSPRRTPSSAPPVPTAPTTPGTATEPATAPTGTPPAGAPGSGTPSVPGRRSVALVFARLKLSLLRNGLRQSTGRTAAFVTSLVFAVLVSALQLLGLIVLRGSEHAANVSVVLSAVLVLGWAVMPLFSPGGGGDETLDPTRLSMLPLRPRSILGGLLLASLIGIGPLFTLTLALGTVIAPASGAAGWAAAACALPLLMLGCVAAARGIAAANVRLLTSRRGRDLALLSGLVIALGVQFVNLGVQKLSEPEGLTALEPFAAVLRWIPPASAAGAVASAGQGDHLTAVAQLALAAAALAGLLWWWQRSLRRLMISPDSSTLPKPSSSDARHGGRNAARLLPRGRTGAVMLRTLRYIWRDPKTKTGWATSLGLGALLPVIMALQGSGSVYQAFWAPSLLGLMMYNQFGQDYSGFWLVASTISTPRDAYVELRARMYALGLIAVPYVGLVVLLSTVLLESDGKLTEMLGLSAALLGGLFAAGSLSSALYPYSIPQDSSNRNAVQGQGSIAWFSSLGGILFAALMCAPVAGLTIWMYVADATHLRWLLLPLGLCYGVGLCALGLRLAASRVSARLPEILTAVSKG